MASNWGPWHVHGPCSVMVGTGTSGALEYLGMTEDGARVSIQIMTAKKRSDASGDAPAVRIARGAIVTVSFKLATWVEAVWAKVLRRSMAAAAVGAAGKIGSVMDAMSGPGFDNSSPWSFALALPGSLDDTWYFSAALLDNGQDVKLSSNATDNALRFECIKPVAGDALDAYSLNTFGSPTVGTADPKQLWARALPS